MADNWHVGNATDEADEHRGWLLRHFMAEPGGPSIRATNSLEVKWGIHPAGQERPAWTSGDEPSRLVVLEFADLAAAKRWYESHDYQEMKKLREGAGRVRMVAVQGVVD